MLPGEPLGRTQAWGTPSSRGSLLTLDIVAGFKSKTWPKPWMCWFSLLIFFQKTSCRRHFQKLPHDYLQTLSAWQIFIVLVWTTFQKQKWVLRFVQGHSNHKHKHLLLQATYMRGNGTGIFKASPLPSPSHGRQSERVDMVPHFSWVLLQDITGAPVNFPPHPQHCRSAVGEKSDFVFQCLLL